MRAPGRVLAKSPRQRNRVAVGIKQLVYEFCEVLDRHIPAGVGIQHPRLLQVAQSMHPSADRTDVNANGTLCTTFYRSSTSGVTAVTCGTFVPLVLVPRARPS